MKIKVKEIVPNPFRDFGLYPIDDEQVQRLRQSIHELGFFSGVTARKANGLKGIKFELSAGHHRVEAAKLEGLDEIEAVVENYSDDEMVAIMAIENLTQRGSNAGSVLDSVAAYARLISRAVLLGDKETSKFLEVSDERTLRSAQAKIAEHGPGMPIIYRAMNGFDRSTRGANKEAEIITSTKIEEALAALKQSGVMGRIVGDALKQVNAIRAERDAEAREEEERRRATEAAIEAKRRKEAERAEAEMRRKEEAAEKARLAAEKAKAQAAEAEKSKKAAAEKVAREAEQRRKEAEAERKAAEKEQAKQREADAKARAEAEKERAKRQAEREAEAERRRKEAEAVKAQRELDKVYDPRVVNVFRLSSHEAAFRKGVLSETGRRFLPVNKQLELAKHIRAEIDKIERDRRVDLGSVTIDAMVNDALMKVLGTQRKIDEEERDRILRTSAEKRVQAHWDKIRRGLVQAEYALARLLEDQKTWQWDKSTFPMDVEAITRIGQMADRFQTLRKKMGLI